MVTHSIDTIHLKPKLYIYQWSFLSLLYSYRFYCRDIRTGKVLQVLTGHTSSVLCLKMFENKIVSGGGEKDRSIRIWYSPSIQNQLFHQKNAYGEEEMSDIPNNHSTSNNNNSNNNNNHAAAGEYSRQSNIIEEHEGSVFSVQFQGNHLFSASADRLINHYQFL